MEPRIGKSPEAEHHLYDPGTGTDCKLSGNQRMTQKDSEISPDPQVEGAPSRMAVAGHPLHPMTVTFPIAFLMAALPSDLAFVLLDDPFWARMSLWLLGAGTTMGVLAGVIGTIELLLVGGIRRRLTSWSHFVMAVMLLAIGFANWMLRLDDAAGAILPWGLYLSAVGAALTAIAGWLGAKLVFHHQIGVWEKNEIDPNTPGQPPRPGPVGHR